MINWHEIANYANGTCLSIDEIAAHFLEDLVGINNETVEEKIEECGIVRCINCGWFVEESECDDEGHCEDCYYEY